METRDYRDRPGWIGRSGVEDMPPWRNRLLNLIQDINASGHAVVGQRDAEALAQMFQHMELIERSLEEI